MGRSAIKHKGHNEHMFHPKYWTLLIGTAQLIFPRICFGSDGRASPQHPHCASINVWNCISFRLISQLTLLARFRYMKMREKKREKQFLVIVVRGCARSRSPCWVKRETSTIGRGFEARERAAINSFKPIM